MKKPILYYYQHCPYCIRVLTLAGLANISLEHRVLLNDDEEKPISMIGAKMVPILETAPQEFMGESLDIIDYLCQNFCFELEKNTNDIKLVEEFFKENRLPIYKLSMPRWIKISFKEFSTPEAIKYFTIKKTKIIGDFDLALSLTSNLSDKLQNSLEHEHKLFEKLQKNTRSLAAIMLFSGLFSISSVKNFKWSKSSQAFMQTMSKESNILLLTNKAL